MSQTKAQLVGGVGISTAENLVVSGIVTATTAVIGTATTFTEDLVVQGDARVTGILTVGTSSITLDGTNNQIYVGTGLTLSSGGITAGIITATSFSGDGSGLSGVDPFPSGTVMLFQQTAAPTGWTKITTHNDKALRVVSGTAGSGGSTAFTSVFTSRSVTGTVGGTTLTTSQIPSHTHDTRVGSNSAGSLAHIQTFYQTGGTEASAPFRSINSNTGGGGSHNHSFSGTALDFAVQYVDVIFASKN